MIVFACTTLVFSAVLPKKWQNSELPWCNNIFR